jgi:cardiolipin synthase A/B
MEDLAAIPLTLGLSLAWAAYLLVLSSWIVLQKRPPLSTLSWILSLAALPLLGFVIYFFLGPQKVRRQRLRRRRRCRGASAGWVRWWKRPLGHRYRPCSRSPC